MKRNLFKRKLRRALAASLGAIAFSSSAFVVNAVSEKDICTFFAGKTAAQLNTGYTSAPAWKRLGLNVGRAINKLNNDVNMNELADGFHITYVQVDGAIIPKEEYRIRITCGGKTIDAKLKEAGWAGNFYLVPSDYDDPPEFKKAGLNPGWGYNNWITCVAENKQIMENWIVNAWKKAKDNAPAAEALGAVGEGEGPEAEDVGGEGGGAVVPGAGAVEKKEEKPKAPKAAKKTTTIDTTYLPTETTNLIPGIATLGATGIGGSLLPMINAASTPQLTSTPSLVSQPQIISGSGVQPIDSVGTTTAVGNQNTTHITDDVLDT